MFIGAETYFRLVRNYRHVWFRGRYGGGKTSLAVATALNLLDSGLVKCCVANVPIAFGEQGLPEVAENAVILMDEGGLFWKTGRAFEKVAAYLRHQNIVVLIPSITPPSLQFRTLTVQRIFNLAAITGVNVWIYQWTIRAGGISEQGKFIWAFPKVFRYYDTNFSAVGDEGIPQWVSGQYAAGNQTSGLLKSDPVEEMTEVVWTMASAADAMERAARKKAQKSFF